LRAAAFIGLRDDVGYSGPAPAAASDPAPADSTGGRPVLGLPLPLWGFLGFMTFVAGSRDFAMWSILDISDFYLSELFGGKASTAWYLFVMYLPGVFFQPWPGPSRTSSAEAPVRHHAHALRPRDSFPGRASPSFLLATTLSWEPPSPASTPVLEAFVADFATPRRGA
jgi:hypothetical protein